VTPHFLFKSRLYLYLSLSENCSLLLKIYWAHYLNYLTLYTLSHALSLLVEKFIRHAIILQVVCLTSYSLDFAIGKRKH
jgi:hypothetical protein